MLIGGIQPFSLCDYPGKVAAVIFLQGCNMRCTFCHNQSLLPNNGQGVSTEEVVSFLQERISLLDGVVVSGGEPTVQKDLIDFLKVLRTMPFSIKLDTNGSNPEMLREILGQKLVDFIGMDVKAPSELYPDITQNKVIPYKDISESIGIISTSGVQHYFRTTWDENVLSEEDIEKIKKVIPAGSQYLVQKCRTDVSKLTNS
jgi:pyruvate formate lyase activating enzyme